MVELKKAKIDKKQIKRLVFQCLIIMVGTFIMAFGYMVFLQPNNILPGGFTGLSQIVHDLFEKVGFTLIPTSIWYIILNIFLYIYAVKLLGLEFGIRAGVGIFSYSMFFSILEKVKFVSTIIEKFQTESALLGGGVYILYAIYGGIIMGIGMGIVFRGEGSTGGCDMVAVVVNKIFPTITTGQIVMFVDGFVCLASVLAYGSLVLPLFALITIFVCGKISDMFVDGIKSLRAYYILTDKKEEITNTIFKEIERGVTCIKCEGMFTHQEKDMLLVILRRSQIVQLKKIVKELDPKSFMFCQSVKNAYGQGFITYEDKKKEKSKQDENKIEKVLEIIDDENKEINDNSLINQEEIIDNEN